MLYLNTANKTDSFTAHHVMQTAAPRDGGLFVPFQIPCFSPEDLIKFHSYSFSDMAAEILSYFFPGQIDSWKLECAIGKCPVKSAPLGQKIFVAELWHNPQEDFSYLESAISHILIQKKPEALSWIKVAIGISVLFYIYCSCWDSKESVMDVSFSGDDFLEPVCGIFAKKMGLPIGNMIINFQDSSDTWNFIRHGNLSTLNPPPQNLERFIFAALGSDEAIRYHEIAFKKTAYRLSSLQLPKLNHEIFPTVVGKNRTQSLVNRFQSAHCYAMGEKTALCYGGVQDYRSKNGESRATLLLSYYNVKE